jgi:predicted ArsR family transcriptional regulator
LIKTIAIFLSVRGAIAASERTPMTNDQVQLQPEATSVPKVARRLGISPNTVRKHFETIHLGNRQFVRVVDVERFLRGERFPGGSYERVA